MKVLIIGNGGREHAMAWKVAQSKQVNQVFVAPGNAGTALEDRVENVDISVTDIKKLITFAKEKKIDLTIVGPEAPLALAIVEQFQAENLAIFGPSQYCAQLESSKAFCKDFLKKYNIPTAEYAVFNEVDPAIAYAKQQNYPLVIKADGLAAGKGVIIAEDFATAEQTIKSILTDQKFGEAGARIVIEEFLEGEELSYIVMSDGINILPFASSQDHKRLNDGDLGPNTGGMGAYSPAPILDIRLDKKILQTIIEPTIQAMLDNNTPYVGFLYAGLMISKRGEPKVLEYNCRLGDPETQPLMMRLQSDLVELCQHALQKKLNKIAIKWDARIALAVVMAAGGYPESYQKGQVIEGLDAAKNTDIKIFHAGTEIKNNHVVTNGGRVLAVTALADDIEMAQQKAYKTCQKIHWPNVFYRHDIGHKAKNPLKIL